MSEILKPKEAADLLHMNVEVLKRLSRAGKVKAAFKIGNRWRYRRDELVGENTLTDKQWERIREDAEYDRRYGGS